MKFFSTPSVALTLAALASCVQAHGYISKPKASYKPNTVYTTYNGLTSASVNKGFAGGIYNHEPENNAKQFAQHWPATGYKSLRDMLDPISPGYGYSLDTATPIDVSSYTEMWWQNDEYKEGFLASHHQCVPISNRGSGEVGGEASTSVQTTPEASTPDATTATPLTTDFGQVDATPAPAMTPVAVSTTGITGTGSCKRRMRS
ncbi:unnamed protein product [Phytophthora fragariaefolia]|uniref:Unnamed protein product n=1 Tax=Phytophthora fragariaefolia TaxID=1490495 RepID=A0A9W7D2S7_9STRA|nr:unnamed protein product [Phytophthora fragariaefolia]